MPQSTTRFSAEKKSGGRQTPSAGIKNRRFCSSPSKIAWTVKDYSFIMHQNVHFVKYFIGEN